MRLTNPPWRQGWRRINAWIVRPTVRRRPAPARFLRDLRAGCASENSHRRANINRIEDRDRVAFRQAHAAMRGGVPGQISGVHSDLVVEAHEIIHRRRLEMAAARHRHVHVRIEHDRVAAASVQLPGACPRDPADQIIIATARLTNTILITKDRELRSYAHVRTLWQ